MNTYLPGMATNMHIMFQDKKVNSTKRQNFTAFADNKILVTLKLKSVLRRLENIV